MWLIRRTTMAFGSGHSSIQQLFQSRDLFYQATSIQLASTNSEQHLKDKAVYCGYDPTAASLHLGNLVSIIMMGRLSLLGLKPIFLIGGATGMIGDPSGKIKERSLLDEKIVLNNIQSLKTQITSVYQNIQTSIENNQQNYGISDEQIGISKSNGFKIVNNYDFYRDMDAIRFLRDVGKHFRMGPLLSREAVAPRLKSTQGISYAQFSYSIIQAYDFLRLFQTEGCLLQFGGSDQWGNITNGCDLVRKTTGKEVFGITMPLLLTKTGQKFGKSQGNALFLNPEITPSQQIFNYLFNTSDEDIEKYFKIFTFYPKTTIQLIMKQHEENRQKKLGQTALAQAVLKLIRPQSTSILQQRQFFTLSYEQLMAKSDQFFKNLFRQMEQGSNQFYKISKEEREGFHNIVDLLVVKKLVKSKSEVRREVEKGGLYMSNRRVEVSELSQTLSDFLSKNLINGGYLLVRWGKKRYQFVHFQT